MERTVIGEPDEAAALRLRIHELAREYDRLRRPPTAFVPGETRIPVSGKVVGDEELENLIDASLDFWLTTGRFAERVRARVRAMDGVRHAILVNSGSSVRTCWRSRR